MGLSLQYTRGPRPAVFCPQDGYGFLSRVGVGQNLMLVEIAAGVFHLDITNQRSDHGFVDAALPGFLDHLAQEGGKHHGRRNDGVPVAEDEGVNALVVQGQLDGVTVGGGWLTTGDIDRIARGPKGWDELFEGRVEI